jgi:hypothetical protein
MPAIDPDVSTAAVTTIDVALAGRHATTRDPILETAALTIGKIGNLVRMAGA